MFRIVLRLAKVKLIGHPQIFLRVDLHTKSFKSLLFLYVGLCLVSKHVNELRASNSESDMKIELCVFLKMDFFGQIQTWGRFSRFFASFLLLTVLNCTDVKIITRSTCSRNLSNLSQLVPVWMLLTCSYSNAQWSTNFSCVQFNGGIKVGLQMSVAGKLLLIKCPNF